LRRRTGRLLNTEADQLGSTYALPFETRGLIGARTARAFTGWWCSYPQPPIPAETPFDAASSAHCAGDMLADALVEHGLPRHQLEADAVIDHGEAAGRADKR
jgi:hypothetical protein